MVVGDECCILAIVLIDLLIDFLLCLTSLHTCNNDIACTVGILVLPVTPTPTVDNNFLLG
jgi:hypothetical protein